MNTFLTVIVPVFNIEEEYLRRCIDSILNQTYKEYELILVDDGSTDSSGKVLDEYASLHDNIIVLHKVNGGSSSARNYAIKYAKGEYVSFIDSDDYIEGDFLEALVTPINEARTNNDLPPLIVQIGRDELDANNNRLADICTPPEVLTFIESKDFLKDLLMHIGDCSFCTKLTDINLLKKYSFPEGKLNEDFNILVKMLGDCAGILSLPGYKYHVFYRVGSNTRKKEKDSFSRVYQDCIDNADMMEDIVSLRYPELMDIALRFAIFQRIEYMLHIPISKMQKEYPGYTECISYLRTHLFKGITNNYLTGKNKVYLAIFALFPKRARILHAKIKHL